MSMARLIDVDEFNKLIAIECANSVKRRVSQLYREGLLTAKLLMDICKTVDAVQIVRCIDCKYWSATKSKENDCDFYGVCEMHGRITLYNDFCQSGTKFDRDGDNDAAD